MTERDEAADAEIRGTADLLASLPDDATAQELARLLTREAILALGYVMRNMRARGGDRIKAAVAILDRGWGKPLLTLKLPEDRTFESMSDDEALAIIQAERERRRSATRQGNGADKPGRVH